jgi:small-conductance mechanosensitive channel
MFNRIVYGDVTVLDLLIAFIVFLASVGLAKAVSVYIGRMLRQRVQTAHINLVRKLVHYSIIVVGIFAVFTILGVNLSGLLVAGGIVGIVLGFASQSIVGNLISGIFLFIERPIGIGDNVIISGTSGTVEDIQVFSTIIRTYEGLYVRIPNEKVFTENITNLSAQVARRFEYEIGIRYSDDADEAIRIIDRVLEETPFVLKKPSRHAFVDNLGDNAVNIVVRVWAPTSEWYSLKMSLLWKLKRTLELEGIQIAFPQRVVWFGKDQEVSEENDAAKSPERGRNVH